MQDGLLKDMLGGRKYPIDLMLLLLFEIIGTTCILVLPEGNPIRVLVTLPILFFLPGWSLASLLWPRLKPDVLQRIAIGIGMSIVIVAGIGLFFAYALDSLNQIAMVLSLLGTTLVFSLTAWFGRNKVAEDSRFILDFNWIFDTREKGNIGRFSVIGLSAIIILSCAGIGYMVLTPNAGESFPELYLLDMNRTVNNLPLNITPNSLASVRVGLVCNAHTAMNYTIISGLESTSGIVYVDNWYATLNLNYDPRTARNITLEPGQEFEDVFNFTFNNTGTQKIVWELRVEGQETECEVHLWIDVYY
ncbi:MAG: DUF1616 domain-containing protein [Thermoplasmata archaeon]|nr:DUF1616 domain-containing protein [Thermoplasmata archaeon]